MDNLIKDINGLISQYSEKLNKINKKPLEEGLTKNAQIFKSYEVQIEFQKEREKAANGILRQLEKTGNKLDLERLNPNNSQFEENNLNDKKNEIKNKKQQIVKIEKLLENVNAGLYENKHTTLEKHKQLQEQLKILEDKMRKISDLLNIFKYVKIEAKKVIDKKLEKEKIKDMKGIFDKLIIHENNLKVNCSINI
jgi:hypothetical protein